DESLHAAFSRAVEKTGGCQRVDRKDVLGRGRENAILGRLGGMDDRVDRGQCRDSCVAFEVAGEGGRAGCTRSSRAQQTKKLMATFNEQRRQAPADKSRCAR